MGLDYSGDLAAVFVEEVLWDAAVADFVGVLDEVGATLVVDSLVMIAADED